MAEESRVVPLSERGKELWPGILLTLGFATLAFLTWWFQQNTQLKFSALLWAFVYSIIATNLFPKLYSATFTPGIELVSTRLVRAAIALLGLTVSASVWAALGGIGIAVVLINLAFTFVFGFLFCRYALKLENNLAILLGVGTSICGASAIAATGPAIRAKAEEMGLSVAAITLFGLLAMFGYPLLFDGAIGNWLGNNHLAYGLWSGVGIHETAQVVAAGSQVSGALSMAMSAKFIRIFMIGPMVFVGILIARRFSRERGAEPVKFTTPWFAVVFILFTLVHLWLESLPVAERWAFFNGTYLKPGVTFLLAWAFAGVGLKVRFSVIRTIGLKAFIGGMIVALVAAGTGLLLVKYLWMPFGI